MNSKRGQQFSAPAVQFLANSFKSVLLGRFILYPCFVLSTHKRYRYTRLKTPAFSIDFKHELQKKLDCIEYNTIG